MAELMLHSRAFCILDSQFQLFLIGMFDSRRFDSMENTAFSWGIIVFLLGTLGIGVWASKAN